jgi:hypothetical protein
MWSQRRKSSPIFNPLYEQVRHYFIDMGNDSLLALFEIPKGKEPGRQPQRHWRYAALRLHRHGGSVAAGRAHRARVAYRQWGDPKRWSMTCS